MNKQDLADLKQQMADIKEYLSTHTCYQCEQAKTKLDELILRLNRSISDTKDLRSDDTEIL